MNSIIISSTIRKAFCCVILLGLFFSTLGAGNLPAAQALISQSPAGATLHGSLSSESKLESQARTVLASNCNGGFSAGQINSYIQCEFGNSPLIGYGATFVSDGQTYNVDPRFVVAISAAESSFGTNQYHNAWGYGGGWPSCWKFSSWQAAIQQVTADIGTYYLPKGQDTIASFVITPAGTCTTHCWCASGCTSWVAIVQQVYKALGGNPNTNNLSYTGNSGGGGGGSAPSTPSSPNPSDGSTLGRTTAITLYWSTNGTSCDISISGGPGTNINQNGVSCSSFTLGQQWPGSYQWHVTAHNSYGTTTGSTWHFNVQPYAPSNLNASTASQTQINLSWTKSGDDPGSVDSYNAYYSNGSLITNIGAGSTSYHVGSLTCNTGYSFYVKAVRQGVLSNASNTASTTTSACITNTAPSTPSNLIISGHTAYSITIAWNAVSKETGYKIYRWDGGTKSFVYLASVGANTTSYTETRSTCGWDQYYEVSAYNNYGESAQTGWVHGYTLACPPASALSNDLYSSATVMSSFPLIQ